LESKLFTENEFMGNRRQLWITGWSTGNEKEDVNILFEDNILTISGEKKTDFKKENSRHHINEICYGKFSRSFELPAHIDSDKIDAKWNEGILNVTIPKTEKAKPKKIKIN